MFKNIYYNNFSNKITLWETVEGKTKKIVEAYEHKYYIKDPTNIGPMEDIYGNKVKAMTAKNNKAVKGLKDSGLDLYESDLNEEIKFLHDKYEKVKLEPDINDYHIGYCDIEIETGGKYNENHVIKLRKR